MPAYLAMPGPDAEPEPPLEAARRPWLPWAAALAVLIVGLLVVLWPGGPIFDLGADPPDEESAQGNGPDAADAAEPEPIGIQAAGDHDPEGGGGENGDQVDNAIDDDPATHWQTVGYDNDPVFGGLKSGVGMWVDLGESRALDRLTLSSAHPGYDLSVFVGDAPPSGGESPQDWGQEVGQVEGGGETQDIPLADGAEGRTVLLWFTSLGPDGGRFRGSISEVAIHGS